MKPPNNTRWVLTWVRDIVELEYWQIDMYMNGHWSAAEAWEQTVVHWQELPPAPRKGGKCGL